MATQIKTITILAGLETYISKLQTQSDTDFQTNYPNTWALGNAPKFEVRRGSRWIKIVSGNMDELRNGGAVFCFIDPDNGDIYKAAGYNTPAKGIRGNIFDEKVPLTSASLYKRL